MKDDTVTTTIRLPKEIQEWLKWKAFSTNTSINELVNMAVKKMITEEEDGDNSAQEQREREI